MVFGLSKMTFIVNDLDRMEQNLTKVLKARKVHCNGSHMFKLHTGTSDERLQRYAKGR